MPRRRPSARRQVAILTETSRAYGRGLTEGIARYSRECGNWDLFFEPRGLEGPPPWLADWKGDGILARFPRREMAQAVLKLGIPVVDLYGTLTGGFPLVGADNDLLARLAVEHFRERGIRNFAFCGLPRGKYPFVDARGDAYQRWAEKAGGSCTLFSVPSERWVVDDWEREEAEIATWLKTLPKPVGVLACYDERGHQVLGACRRAGLAAPDEVAVLAAGNDPAVCELCTPPLSSIDLDAVRIGYRAAACLDRMMRGGRAPRQPIGIAPRAVIARQSSDVLATEDPELAAALRFIRERACDGLRVGDVLKHVAVSQSALQRKFHSLLGRTPKAEILRVQLDKARELLVESDLQLKEIARRCGFAGEKYFSDAFFRQAGERPANYRKDRRRGNAGMKIAD